MLWLLGLIVGGLIALGPLSSIGSPGTAFAATLIDTFAVFVDTVVNRYAADNDAAIIIGTLIAVGAPGLVAAALIAVGRAGKQLRQFTAYIALIAGVVVVAVNRDMASVITAIALVVFGLVVTVAATGIISFVSSLLASLIAIGQVKLIVDNDTSGFAEAQTTLLGYVPEMDPTLLTGALCLLALAPVLAVLAAMFRPGR